jgi:predicted short-subunit dehydrogenase-like oxidoreductase (DUF2520 family)
MGRTRITTCCIIGSGNVAWHLAQALAQKIKVVGIYSRNVDNATKLADKIGCSVVSSLASLPQADLYLISVKDDAISQIVDATDTIDGGIWVHTSGSVPASVFQCKKRHYGVFYPLQTFSKAKDVDIAKVPFFVEANEASVTESLIDLAQQLSDSVVQADSEMRKRLHVAAVFACNFVNYMWIEADELLQQSGLDISYLRPLLKETLAKLDDLSPIDAQTGPARRGDRHIIEQHLKSLSGEKHDIYSLISQSILKKYST